MSFLSRFFGPNKSERAHASKNLSNYGKGKKTTPYKEASSKQKNTKTVSRPTKEAVADKANRAKSKNNGSVMPGGGPRKVSTSSKPAPAKRKRATAKSSTAKSSTEKYIEAPRGGKQTKDGFYPTYKKKSKTAGSFRKAFAAARKANKKEFTWKGRKYNTKVK